MKHFDDALAVKQRIAGSDPVSFRAPTKDEFYAGKYSAGDKYGVGHRTPVGTLKTSNKCVVPHGCMRLDPEKVIYEQK